MVCIKMGMNPIIDKIYAGEVVIEDLGTAWKVTCIGNRFLDWMRHNFKDEEDKNWQLYYYSGTMCMIEIVDEKIMTLINLTWL